VESPFIHDYSVAQILAQFIFEVNESDTPTLNINKLIDISNSALKTTFVNYSEDFQKCALIIAKDYKTLTLPLSDYKIYVTLPVVNPNLSFLKSNDLLHLRHLLSLPEYQNDAYKELRGAVDLEIIKI
jgi:hypothetical protein